MNGMINMLRTMDNATIKSMMQMQGMNLTDEQISMMKMSMTPDTLKMMKNHTGGFPNMPKGNTAPIQNSNNSSNFSSNTNNNLSTSTGNENPNPTPPFKGGFPDMKNMDMGSMLKFVQDNPNIMNMMGPQFSQMFGQNGGNNDAMMKSMQNILWLISLPSRAKSYFSTTQGKIIILFLIILIISYFYK